MRIEITEVGLRDGLQNEAEPFSTAQKLQLARMLIGAGVRRLEATSFVSPRAVPQMADAEAVIEGIEDLRDGVTVEALVANPRGGERAAAAGWTSGPRSSRPVRRIRWPTPTLGWRRRSPVSARSRIWPGPPERR